MVVFNQDYYVSEHAVNSWVDRSNNPFVTVAVAPYLIKDDIRRGRVILETGNHRYVLGEGDRWFYPCVKGNDSFIVVKTAMPWDYKKDSFESVVRKYYEEDIKETRIVR